MNTASGVLVVYVKGPAVNYSVIVTCPTGIVCSGTTDDMGIAVLMLPRDPDLELTVIGTSVVGVPVQAGQLLSVHVD